MRVQALGHATLKVRDLNRAEAFYNGVLGIPIAARLGVEMTFFTFGNNHHDFAVQAVGEQAPSAEADAVGLAHVAFKIGNTLEDLRQAKLELERAGIALRAASDHNVSQSLYLSDPDGNGVELYVDVSDAWRSDPQAVAVRRSLEL
jgi:catechol 2,3-dioxygenase